MGVGRALQLNIGSLGMLQLSIQPNGSGSDNSEVRTKAWRTQLTHI